MYRQTEAGWRRKVDGSLYRVERATKSHRTGQSVMISDTHRQRRSEWPSELDERCRTALHGTALPSMNECMHVDTCCSYRAPLRSAHRTLRQTRESVQRSAGLLIMIMIIITTTTITTITDKLYRNFIPHRAGPQICRCFGRLSLICVPVPWSLSGGPALQFGSL